MTRLLLALCLCLGACSGAQKVSDPARPAEAGAEPTAEDLKECPCGDANADWSELPEGSDPAEPE